MDKVQLRPFAGPLIAVLVAGALLVASFYWSDGWREQKERAFNRARSQLSEAARQYRSASDDRAVYRQYADRFRDMAERGWIGKEHRLTWIESLQAINGDLKLPTLRYKIGQRQPVEDNDIAGRLHLYRTPMQLEIGALHEYDVVELLQRLSRQGDGLMALSTCDLQRNGPVRLDPRAVNVQADCALDWYTLRLDTDAG